ncbi:hypothetical protein ACLOJK_031768 [Asimina triloba]
MGKKSREGDGETSDVFSTLFSDSNPYRRKPQSHQDELAETKESNQSQLGLESADQEQEENTPSDSREKYVDLAEAKKTRKRERERNPSPESNVRDSETVGKKRKKRTVDDDPLAEQNAGEGNGDGKKKKRKRAEIEEEYEMRKYGGELEKIDGGGEQPSRTVVGEKRKAGDDSKEMVISKDAYDDESKLQRTVFVGNLPLKVKKKALLKEFGQFGEIESIRIRSVPIADSKIPRKGAIIKGKLNDSVDSVHAYIVFKNEQSAGTALSHNMTKFGDNHIRVDRACPPRKKLKGESSLLYDNKRTVFVGNLPFDVKDEEIYQLFCGVNQAEIEAIRVVRDPHSSMGKGIAYVMFKTRGAANAAVKKHLKLRDRDLRISHARPESTPFKRKQVLALEDGSPKRRKSMDSHQKPLNTNKSNNVKRAATDISYQGVRASKSGVQKKGNLQPKTGNQGKLELKRGRGSEPNVRSSKRPAVAARKAKALKFKASGGSAKQTGKKRKMESRTPENTHRHKKARKYQ